MRQRHQRRAVNQKVRELSGCEFAISAPVSISATSGSPEELAVENLPRPILFLVNGHSRQGREQFEPALAALRAAGLNIKEAILARDKAETQRLLKREIAEHANMVIAGGGDGTLSLCADFLAGTPVALAALPLGTGNTFARSIGLPVKLEDAISTIAAGHIEAIDVGKCNGDIFLNSVSLGFSASLAGELTGDVKKTLGLLAWPVTGLKLALSHRPSLLRISSKEENFVARTHQLMIANGRYVAGSIKASDDASVQNSELMVFALGGAGRGEFIKSALNWILRHDFEGPGTHFFQTQKLTVSSRGRAVQANVDGELTHKTPLEIEIWPRALRVVVPKGFVADEA